MDQERERRIERLQESTGENTKSKAIDRAATYYTRMRGGCDGVPNGRIEELLERAVQEGSLSAGEIAEILDTPEVPLDVETRVSIGDT